jgi:hypothetical protein
VHHEPNAVPPEAGSPAQEAELEHEAEHGHHAPHESPWVVTVP